MIKRLVLAAAVLVIVVYVLPLWAILVTIWSCL